MMVAVMKMVTIALVVLIVSTIISIDYGNNVYSQSSEVSTVKFSEAPEAIIPLRDIYSALSSGTITTLYLYKGFPRGLNLYEDKSYIEVYIGLSVEGTDLWTSVNSSSIAFRGYEAISMHKLKTGSNTNITLYVASLYRYNSFYITVCLQSIGRHLFSLEIYSYTNLSVDVEYNNAFNIGIDNRSLYLVLLNNTPMNYKHTERGLTVNAILTGCTSLLIGFDKIIKYLSYRSVNDLIAFSGRYFADLLQNLPMVYTKYKPVQDLYVFSVYIKLNRLSRIGYVDFYTGVNPLDIASLSYLFRFSKLPHVLLYLLDGFNGTSYDINEPIAQYSYLEVAINLYKVYRGSAKRYINDRYLQEIYSSATSYAEKSGGTPDIIKLGLTYIVLEKLQELCSYIGCRNLEHIDYYLDYIYEILVVYLNNSRCTDEGVVDLKIFALLSRSSCAYINCFAKDVEKLINLILSDTRFIGLYVVALARCNYTDSSVLLLNTYFENIQKQHSLVSSFEYIVLYGFYGVDMDEQYLVLVPTLPAPLANTSIRLYVNNYEIYIHYLGWGSIVSSVHVGIHTYRGNRVSLDQVFMYRRIFIKLDKRSSNSLLYIDIKEGGEPARYRSIVIYVPFYNFSTVVYTNGNGTAVVSLPCLCPVVIVISNRSYSTILRRCMDEERISIDIGTQSSNLLKDLEDKGNTMHSSSTFMPDTDTSFSTLVPNDYTDTGSTKTSGLLQEQVVRQPQPLQTTIATIILILTSGICTLIARLHFKGRKT